MWEGTGLRPMKLVLHSSYDSRLPNERSQVTLIPQKGKLVVGCCGIMEAKGEFHPGEKTESRPFLSFLSSSFSHQRDSLTCSPGLLNVNSWEGPPSLD